MPIAKEIDDDLMRRWLGIPTGRRSLTLAALRDSQPPGWLDLSPADIATVKDFLADVADYYRASSEDEFMWCLLADAVLKRRSSRRGRKPKWLASDGLIAVLYVQAVLDEAGASTRDPKVVPQALVQLQRAMPELFGGIDFESLRASYYEARRRFGFSEIGKLRRKKTTRKTLLRSVP